MAELKKIRQKIGELAGRRKNVTAEEIEWVANQLKQHGYVVTCRQTTHGKLFGVNAQRFSVCCHNPGSRQVKTCYVDAFLDAMIDLELYED
jgi:hypothetical protein